MTDYEWETGHAARPNVGGRAEGMRRGNRSLEEYAALEYPKESAVWLLRSAELHRSTPSARAEERLRDPVGRPKRRVRGLESDG